MHLTITELMVLEQLGHSTNFVPLIAKNLNKSVSQIYYVIRSLEHKGLVSKYPLPTPHIHLLIQQITYHPQLIPLFADIGIFVLERMQYPRTIEELCCETNFSKSSVYAKLKAMRKISLIKQSGPRFSINSSVWPTVAQFVDALSLFKKSVDARIPANAIIYQNDSNIILYSTPDGCDATLTAFSAFSNFGLQLLSPNNYYCLPKQDITIQIAFDHALTVCTVTHDYQSILYTILFYLKFEKELSANHSLVKNALDILARKPIKGYPSREDIVEKAEQYDIDISRFGKII